MANEQRPIVDTVLGDVAALIPQLSSTVASYRLLVGAAEELRRTTGCKDITERAILRADRAGTLIDMLLEVLCRKVTFSSNFLAVSAAPVDVFGYLSAAYACDSARLTAEQIIELEALRQLLCKGRSDSCFPEPESCVPQKPVGTKPTAQTIPADIADELKTEVTEELSAIIGPQQASHRFK